MRVYPHDFSLAAAAAAALSSAIAVSAVSCGKPRLASAAATLDVVVLAMLLIVVNPTPNLEIFLLFVLRNLARLARGPGKLFFWNYAFP